MFKKFSYSFDPFELDEVEEKRIRATVKEDRILSRCPCGLSGAGAGILIGIIVENRVTSCGFCDHKYADNIMEIFCGNERGGA